MRKVKILIFSIIACLFINVSALTYTEEEVVDRINSSKVSVNELLGDLINWSDTNKNATKKLVNKDFVKSINSLDFETNLNKTISKLRSSGETKAADDLEALKEKLLNNYNSYKETLKITKTYLEERKDYGVNGNLDVFIAIRELAKYNKSSITTLGKIYYSDGFNYVYDNVDKYTIDEVIDKFDYVYELDIVNKLFNKFERLDLEENITIEGTGLGLAITKKLVDLMHGAIVVQSVYGKGSKFTVSIDQRIVKNPTIKVDAPVVKNDDIKVNNKLVLVVDDNKINLKVAERLLGTYGITTECVESGFICIDNLKNGKKYDLILMDDMMPKLSGVETLHKIKEQIPDFNIPTVALTANALTGMREKYLADGFNDYLAKPISKDELNRVINEYLNKE